MGFLRAVPTSRGCTWRRCRRPGKSSPCAAAPATARSSNWPAAPPPCRLAAAQRLLGDLTVDVIDADDLTSPTSVELVDVCVITHHPTPGAPERVDLVLGAGTENTMYGALAVPEAPTSYRFEVRPAHRSSAGPIGTCLEARGLYPQRPPRPEPIHLIGCEPGEALLDRQKDPRPRPWEAVWLAALDGDGRVMHHLGVDIDITDVRPSVLGGTLLRARAPRLREARGTARSPRRPDRRSRQPDCSGRHRRSDMSSRGRLLDRWTSAIVMPAREPRRAAAAMQGANCLPGRPVGRRTPGAAPRRRPRPER